MIEWSAHLYNPQLKSQFIGPEGVPCYYKPQGFKLILLGLSLHVEI